MLPYIAITALVIFASYWRYRYFMAKEIDSKYAYTYIYVVEHDEKDNVALKKDRFDATFNQFYNHRTLDILYNNKDISLPVEMHRSAFVTYQKFTEIYINRVGPIIRNYKYTVNEKDRVNFEKFVDRKLVEFVKVAEVYRNGKTSIECDHDFLEYRMKLQSLMLKIVKEINNRQNELVKTLHNALYKLKYLTLIDRCHNTNGKEELFCKVKYFLHKNKQERKQELLSFLLNTNQQLQGNDYNHCVLDLTYLYLDKISHIIGHIKSKTMFEQVNYIQTLKEEVFDIIDDSIRFSLEAINEMKHCKYERITIVFDIFLVLEIAIARNCPDKAYKLISASLKEIVNSIYTIHNAKKEKHGRFFVEVLDIKDFMKIKLYSHTKTQLMFEKLSQHIESNSSADSDKLVELKKLKNFVKPSRWYFDGSLFNSLVNPEDDISALKDIDRLFAIYNKNSRLVIDTCTECNGFIDDFCEQCAKLIWYFGNMCVLTRYYRSLLVRKTQLYYYQNMVDLITYAREDEEIALQNEQNIEHDDKAIEVFVEKSDGQNLENSDDVGESKMGFEHSKSGVTQSKRNKICKDPIVRKVKRRP